MNVTSRTADIETDDELLLQHLQLWNRASPALRRRMLFSLGVSVREADYVVQADEEARRTIARWAGEAVQPREIISFEDREAADAHVHTRREFRRSHLQALKRAAAVSQQLSVKDLQSLATTRPSSEESGQ